MTDGAPLTKIAMESLLGKAETSMLRTSQPSENPKEEHLDKNSKSKDHKVRAASLYV